ncbi:nucleoside deaminase [Liquorilactobacillus vini]|uniref:Guanine deaminase n=1 Tax=Liquorilactobacillus vini DSM 20605 TaxID=1133569 RepID=A0A0R2CM90_9LACO|nr:nucleoside deaminase [Liquorilactobacillus vini]KRM88931.1 guanine deaminase [Liquorilactobacillus vini DSM 20605]
MSYQKKFMEMAAKQALSNVGTQIGGPFGTVIVKNDQVIVQAHNCVLQNHDPSAHGEITAIRQACQKLGTHDLSGYELYTNAYPCPMCLGAIIWSNIKTVYYGNTASDAAKIGFRDDFIYQFIQKNCQNSQILNLQQRDRSLTIKAFQAFQSNNNSKLY